MTDVGGVRSVSVLGYDRQGGRGVSKLGVVEVEWAWVKEDGRKEQNQT